MVWSTRTRWRKCSCCQSGISFIRRFDIVLVLFYRNVKDNSNATIISESLEVHIKLAVMGPSPIHPSRPSHPRAGSCLLSTVVFLCCHVTQWLHWSANGGWRIIAWQGISLSPLLLLLLPSCPSWMVWQYKTLPCCLAWWWWWWHDCCCCYVTTSSSY